MASAPVFSSRWQPLIILFLASLIGIGWLWSHYQPNTDIRQTTTQDWQKLLSAELRLITQDKYYQAMDQRQLLASQEIITTLTGIPVTAMIGTRRLPHYIGYIGLEQHLPRYPGDRGDPHDPYSFHGITPKLGAFGYFASSSAYLTEKVKLQEKYYVAVPLMYLPEWHKDWQTLKPWYKFRPVMVVNPLNGKSAIAVIADAGPARFTGKQFGGSPELIDYLDYSRRPRPAILMFVSPTQANQVTPGPVDPKPEFKNLQSRPQTPD